MIERVDIFENNKNKTFQLFVDDHKFRYKIARQLIEKRRFSDEIIIDAAYGAGYGYEYLSSLGTYIGIDNSLDAKILAKNYYFDGDFRVGNIEDYKLSELKPTAIVSLETAEHLDNPFKFFKNVYNALPLNGIFIFSAPTYLTMDYDPFHKRDLGLYEWNELLEEAGFTVKSYQKTGFTCKFTDFVNTVPTTLKQKWSILKFCIKNKKYGKERFQTWILKNKFRWESTLFECKIVPNIERH